GPRFRPNQIAEDLDAQVATARRRAHREPLADREEREVDEHGGWTSLGGERLVPLSPIPGEPRLGDRLNLDVVDDEVAPGRVEPELEGRLTGDPGDGEERHAPCRRV